MSIKADEQLGFSHGAAEARAGQIDRFFEMRGRGELYERTSDGYTAIEPFQAEYARAYVRGYGSVLVRGFGARVIHVDFGGGS